MAAYQRLIEPAAPASPSEFFRHLPRPRSGPRRSGRATLKKKAQEVARYVLPIGTFAHLYHTVSGLTLHRYHRLCRRRTTCRPRPRWSSRRWSARSRRIDPLFFREVGGPDSRSSPRSSARALREAGRAGGRRRGGAHVPWREFDAGLAGKRLSALVDWSARRRGSVAQARARRPRAARATLLDDEAALERVLSPRQNPYLAEALLLTHAVKLTRALVHAHYTFQKKLCHTADSQDQRHRMTPGRRPLLQAHFVPASRT